MKKIIAINIALIISVQLFGQNYQSDFQNAIKTKDTISQFDILSKWETNSPNNPELLTSYFNYYFLKSRKEVITLSTKKPEGEGIVLTDSLNKTAGYIGSDIYFDKKILQKGFDKIDEGIKLYPNRLDMRFGKIYTLGEIKDWDNFTNEILKSIDFSSVNNNNWTWTNNEPVENSKDFFLSGLQDYIIQLYNTGNDELLKNMRSISNTILKYYPDNIENMSNLSITYLAAGEYDNAIQILLKAEQINPKDYIVLNNIAYGYKMKGEKDKAIENYEKVENFGDQDAKDFAKQQIESLKKD